MKNALIILLAAGLGVSLYFNWKNCGNSSKSAGLSDSTEISFSVLNDKPMSDTAGPKPGVTKDTLHYSVTGNISSQKEDGILYLGKVCCPIPPKDTSMRSVCIDPNKIVGIQIKSLGQKKP